MTPEAMAVDEGVTPAMPTHEENTAEGVLKETDMKLLCNGKTLCIPVTQVGGFSIKLWSGGVPTQCTDP